MPKKLKQRTHERKVFFSGKFSVARMRDRLENETETTGNNALSVDAERWAVLVLSRNRTTSNSYVEK